MYMYVHVAIVIAVLLCTCCVHVHVQVPGGMLRQVRFLYESDMKKFSERSVRQIISKMHHEQPTSRSRHSQEVNYTVHTYIHVHVHVCIVIHV